MRKSIDKAPRGHILLITMNEKQYQDFIAAGQYDLVLTCLVTRENRTDFSVARNLGPVENKWILYPLDAFFLGLESWEVGQLNGGN